MGAETIVVLIGNDRQIGVDREHVKPIPFCKRGEILSSWDTSHGTVQDFPHSYEVFLVNYCKPAISAVLRRHAQLLHGLLGSILIPLVHGTAASTLG